MSFPEQAFTSAINSTVTDLRLSQNARFMDQKVTPDVLSYISDAILNLPPDIQLTFTKDTIWASSYFKETVKDVFGKPDADNENADNEYDKFAAQPLKMLSYAGILKESRIGNRNYYTLLHKDALEYIAQNPRNAIEYLDKYLVHVLRSSDMWSPFEVYFQSACDDSDLQKLKAAYIGFILANTKINKPVEVRHIFTKVLNPLAYKRTKPGTQKGHVSKNSMLFSDLMYNQINFRDAGKQKNLTRFEAQEALELNPPKKTGYLDYLNQKAKQSIRRRHSPLSEVRGKLSEGLATQVHHIFPASKFPDLIDVPENLILLTPSQHFTLAHPDNKTFLIDETYQIQCLIAKISSITESNDKSDGFYDLLRFVKVINAGYGLELAHNSSLDQIDQMLNEMLLKK